MRLVVGQALTGEIFRYGLALCGGEVCGLGLHQALVHGPENTLGWQPTDLQATGRFVKGLVMTGSAMGLVGCLAGMNLDSRLGAST